MSLLDEPNYSIYKTNISSLQLWKGYSTWLVFSCKESSKKRFQYTKL